jgi:hypothetical protein
MPFVWHGFFLNSAPTRSAAFRTRGNSTPFPWAHKARPGSARPSGSLPRFRGPSVVKEPAAADGSGAAAPVTAKSFPGSYAVPLARSGTIRARCVAPLAGGVTIRGRGVTTLARGVTTLARGAITRARDVTSRARGVASVARRETHAARASWMKIALAAYDSPGLAPGCCAQAAFPAGSLTYEATEISVQGCKAAPLDGLFIGDCHV